jgi:hypothetical protein
VTGLESKPFVSLSRETDFSGLRETWLYFDVFLLSDSLCGFSIMLSNLSVEFNELNATVIELEQCTLKLHNNIKGSLLSGHSFASVGITEHTSELVSTVIFQLVCERIL